MWPVMLCNRKEGDVALRVDKGEGEGKGLSEACLGLIFGRSWGVQYKYGLIVGLFRLRVGSGVWGDFCAGASQSQSQNQSQTQSQTQSQSQSQASLLSNLRVEGLQPKNRGPTAPSTGTCAE
jgi:hypothetical protein